MPEDPIDHINFDELNRKAISAPLVTHMYTADPSAHVFKGRIYIYPSHDIDAGIPFDDLGSHFAMEDYHVFSMDKPGAGVVDHGVALHVNDIPWASKQLWAPDAAFKNGKYYLYFPAKKEDGIFQIGVAVGDKPEGPFKAEPLPIQDSYSIDPAVFVDDDGSAYMYFGGLWGGQLQNYRNNKYDVNHAEPKPDEPALGPRVAKLTDDMLQMAETVKEIQILDEAGKPLLAGDNDRRFF
ncbi:MAG: family 43 glycosylhydrolase [Chitinophagaceae bacterium]|nr:family 43 glycosylhydrolase [Chitinophagaceae bacterium]